MDRNDFQGVLAVDSWLLQSELVAFAGWQSQNKLAVPPGALIHRNRNENLAVCCSCCVVQRVYPHVEVLSVPSDQGPILHLIRWVSKRELCPRQLQGKGMFELSADFRSLMKRRGIKKCKKKKKNDNNKKKNKKGCTITFFTSGWHLVLNLSRSF